MGAVKGWIQGGDPTAKRSRGGSGALFLGNLTVSPVKNSRLVRLSYDSPEPEGGGAAAKRRCRELHQPEPRASLRGVVIRKDIPGGADPAGPSQFGGFRAASARLRPRAGGLSIWTISFR